MLHHARVASTTPLRIDSELVHRARTAAALGDRTPTAQLEHWAKLGLALEPVLSGESTQRVKQVAQIADWRALVADSQTTAGQQRVQELVRRHGGPVYEADPENPEWVLERQPDGSVRRGKFVNRQFKPVRQPRRAKSRT